MSKFFCRLFFPKITNPTLPRRPGGGVGRVNLILFSKRMTEWKTNLVCLLGREQQGQPSTTVSPSTCPS